MLLAPIRSCSLPSVTQSLYLHYCGIFPAHSLMKIDRNIISSLQYSLLTLRATNATGLCDVFTEFTNVIKVDVDVNGISLFNI